MFFLTSTPTLSIYSNHRTKRLPDVTPWGNAVRERNETPHQTASSGTIVIGLFTLSDPKGESVCGIDRNRCSLTINYLIPLRNRNTGSWFYKPGCCLLFYDRLFALLGSILLLLPGGH